MRILKCSCCGEDVTMPSFKDRKPYGYTCFSRLFGKNKKPTSYVPVDVKNVIRCWADLKDTMSTEGWEMKKDHFTITYLYKFISIKSKPMLSQSEFAIQDEDGKFWIPKNELKKALLKFKISHDEVKEEMTKIAV